MEITINVTLGLSAELKETAERIIAGLRGLRAVPENAAAVPATVDPPAEYFREERPEAVAVAEEEPEVKTQAPSIPDDEEMRQHMDMVVSKFAGNNWKEQKDSRTQAIRKGCTAAFKEIAKVRFDAEKPTALEGEDRLKFIDELNRIFIKEVADGKGAPVIEYLPF